jgi:hypothetical protein
MCNNSQFAIDGFGREAENPDEIILFEQPEFSELQMQKERRVVEISDAKVC